MLDERGPLENTELRENDEPSVGAEPVAATEAAAVVPLDEPDRQHPDADELTLAKLERTKEPGLPVEAAAAAEPGLPLTRQLIGSVRLGGNEQLNWTLIGDAVGLYQSLKPQDPIESIISRLIVAGTNATMDCLERAAQFDGSSRARELNLRYGLKGAPVVADLIKLLGKSPRPRPKRPDCHGARGECRSRRPGDRWECRGWRPPE